MSPEECISIWKNAEPQERARALDHHSPSCGCEVHSLRNSNLNPISSVEFVARILTTPDGCNLTTKEILRTKLVAAFSSGVSLVRQGATEAEIELTVSQLTQSSEPNSLAGAAILAVSEIRNLGNPERWFCVYDTEEEKKVAHADILATTPTAASGSAAKKLESRRRKSLQTCLQANVYLTNSLDELKTLIRLMGTDQMPEATGF